jgi:hypothetical protein
MKQILLNPSLSSCADTEHIKKEKKKYHFNETKIINLNPPLSSRTDAGHIKKKKKK